MTDVLDALTLLTFATRLLVQRPERLPRRLAALERAMGVIIETRRRCFAAVKKEVTKMA